MSQHLTIPDALAQRLTTLAAQLQRPLDDVAGELLERAIDDEEVLRQVEAGEMDFEHGRVHTTDDVAARLDAIIAAARR